MSNAAKACLLLVLLLFEQSRQLTKKVGPSLIILFFVLVITL